MNMPERTFHHEDGNDYRPDFTVSFDVNDDGSTGSITGVEVGATMGGAHAVDQLGWLAEALDVVAQWMRQAAALEPRDGLEMLREWQALRYEVRPRNGIPHWANDTPEQFERRLALAVPIDVNPEKK